VLLLLPLLPLPPLLHTLIGNAGVAAAAAAAAAKRQTERAIKRRDEDDAREGGERSPTGWKEVEEGREGGREDIEGRSSQGWLQGLAAMGFYGITRSVPTSVHRGVVSSRLARVSALP